MKKLLLSCSFLGVVLLAGAQNLYTNGMNDAYYSYAKEDWGDVSVVNPIIDFAQEWNDEGVLNVTLAGAGGVDDKGDRFVYALTEVVNDATVPTSADMSSGAIVTVRLKSDVSFELQLDISDNAGITNDADNPITSSVIAGSEFVDYTFQYAGAYKDYQDRDVATDMISTLAFIFNNESNGTAVSGLIEIDEIKIDAISASGTVSVAVYDNTLNDAYYSYGAEDWTEVDKTSPASVVSFDDAWNNEGVLDLALNAIGGEGDNGDRFVYAFTGIDNDVTVPVNVDFTKGMTVSVAIKSDIAFDLGLFISDKGGLWNDGVAAVSNAVSVSNDFVVYDFKFESAYTDWEATALMMDMISELGFVFNDKTGGTAVTGNVSFDFVKVTYDEVVGVSTGFDASTITTYPNPTSNFVKVNLPNTINGVVSVFDVTGQLVAEKTIAGREVNVSLIDLPAGQYILNIVSENGVVAKKVIKN